ncbi:MAG: asparagine synthase (glutamine-hydrolyzing) [Phycisphaerae bacterium]
MCGFAGGIRLDGNLPAPGAAAEAARLLTPRGPDGEGHWQERTPAGAVWMQHRRLAILDRAGGEQPMSNETGTVRVVFNGEIYNHADLRRQLEALGHKFASDHSDTEVLVHGWEQWGTELPEHLLGMFAFALYDRAGGQWFMARDEAGQKPLYYAADAAGVVCASTLPALLALGLTEARPAGAQVQQYLQLGYIPAPGTIYENIFQLPPQTWALWCGGELTLRRYTSLTVAGPGDLADVLQAAVARHLQADVPLVCFLSGGIDSALIAWAMQLATRRAGGAAITTVSVGFAEADFDESPYAAEVARILGTRHQRIVVGAHGDVAGGLEALITEVLGQPFADSSLWATQQISAAARGLGTVALSGDGGDEIFGGYDRYRGLALARAWRAAVGWLPDELGTDVPGGVRWGRLIRAARAADTPGAYARLVELWSGSRELPPVVGPTGTPGEYAQSWDWQHYLSGDVLCKVDTAAMSVGLEVRAPLLDPALRAWVRQHRPRLWDGRRGKLPLRALAARLFPPAISARRKQGFGVPIGTWFRGVLRENLLDRLLSRGAYWRAYLPAATVTDALRAHLTGTADHTHRLYALWVLEMWSGELRGKR